MNREHVLRPLVDLIVGGLAVYRLTELVAFDEGPWGIFWELRERFPQANHAQPKLSWVGRGLRCPKCLSFWFGPLVGLLMALPFGRILVMGLALAGLRYLARVKNWDA